MMETDKLLIFRIITERVFLHNRLTIDTEIDAMGIDLLPILAIVQGN
jgi:hypothetical protein